MFGKVRPLKLWFTSANLLSFFEIIQFNDTMPFIQLEGGGMKNVQWDPKFQVKFI
jgi:hypothetical protein